MGLSGIGLSGTADKWDRPKWDRPKWDRAKWDRAKRDRLSGILRGCNGATSANRTNSAADCGAMMN